MNSPQRHINAERIGAFARWLFRASPYLTVGVLYVAGLMLAANGQPTARISHTVVHGELAKW